MAHHHWGETWYGKFPYLSLVASPLSREKTIPYLTSVVLWWDILNSFHTLISDSSASFRFRVDKTWKGWICFFSRSQATASESRTQDLTASNLQLWNRFMISGYFVVLSSWFREKILISPFSNKWICARSPSYFHSQVNLAFSKRVRTSWTPLIQDKLISNCVEKM